MREMIRSKYAAAIFVLLLTGQFYIVATGSPDGTEATTSGNIVIRRRLPSGMSSGGGRLSLMNNRFNRRPRKKNMDSDQLLDLLGSFFDGDWMSVEEPASLSGKDPDRGATYVIRNDNWQRADMVKQLQATNMSQELAQLGGSRAFEDPIFARTVEKWLMKRASCPVRYAWEDIGSLFWPRYIKRGECASVPGTCSWPPGMHCVPSGTTTLQVLRWQCKVPRGNKGRRKTFKNPKKNILVEGDQTNLKCSWIRVPYPITSDCLCTC